MDRDKDGKLAPRYNFQVIASSGAFFSTANDLSRFVAANLDITQTELNPLIRRTQIIRHKVGRIRTHAVGRSAMPWTDKGVYNPPGSKLLGHAGGCHRENVLAVMDPHLPIIVPAVSRPGFQGQ